MAEIRIGTSGWHYDHWVGPFYPDHMKPADFLAFYAERFTTAEINNSFYQLPSATTLAQWRDAVPDGFRFTAKASRYITHMKKLKDPAASLERFLERIAVLTLRLGPARGAAPGHRRLGRPLARHTKCRFLELKSMKKSVDHRSAVSALAFLCPLHPYRLRTEHQRGVAPRAHDRIMVPA